MRRPWILSETRLFKFNRIRVVYAGHNNQGSKATCGYQYGPASEFHLLLRWLWDASFTTTVLGVLSGEIGMYSVSDFIAILPAYTKALGSAYQRMSRNDYLLTAAILCGEVQEAYSTIDFDDLTFDLYKFRRRQRL